MGVMPRAIPTAMRRVVVCAMTILALLPAVAEAKIIELGQTDQQPTPSCPAKPCLAVSRTTGYQAKVGTQRGLFTAPEPGRIVAWSITLGAPTAKQVKFFNTTLGGAPSAGITVFKPAQHLYGTITAQSPVEPLTDYLGETVQFPLEKSLAIKKGQSVALTVPTWAPALAIGFGTDTSWRASRTKKQCDDTSSQTAVTTLGTVTRFLCLYKTARLSYSVTLVTDPHGPKKTTKTKTKAKKTATKASVAVAGNAKIVGATEAP
jgi:hypothetical protein